MNDYDGDAIHFARYVRDGTPLWNNDFDVVVRIRLGGPL